MRTLVASVPDGLGCQLFLQFALRRKKHLTCGPRSDCQDCLRREARGDEVVNKETNAEVVPLVLIKTELFVAVPVVAAEVVTNDVVVAAAF